MASTEELLQRLNSASPLQAATPTPVAGAPVVSSEAQPLLDKLNQVAPTTRPETGPGLSDPQRVPDVTEDGAFSRNVEQGLLNIGGGILRGIGEIRKLAGDEEADKFLQDLAVSQSIERQKTKQISADQPIKSFAGEVLGETIGFPLGGGGSSLLARLLSGAAASGAAGGLSAAGRGEKGTDVAIEAGIGAVLAPVLEGATALSRARRTSRQADELVGVAAETEGIQTAAANVQEAIQAQAETGIRTLPAQKTLDPFQLESQAFIGQNPEASSRAFNVLRQQNREAAQAVDGLLSVIASPKSPATSPAAARTAAGNIVNAQKLMRSEAASPIYKQAFRRQRQGFSSEAVAGETFRQQVRGKNPLIDTDSLQLKAQKMAEQFDPSGQVSKNINTFLEKVSNAGGDLAKLHNAKLEIDQIIEARGENSIGNTTKRFLTGLQKDLVDQMTEQSPSYRAARDEFRRLSPLVDEVRGGVFGRIADLDDKDLKRASAVIFDATESNPEITRNAIRALKNVEGGDEIASGLLRTEIEKRLGRMKSELGELSETGGRKLENVPANLLNNFFGNAKQKRMLMGALAELNPKAAENAKWLEKSLIRASSGRPGGSQTGIRAVITEKLRGVSLGIRSFFKKPIETLAGIGEEAAFSRKAAAMGEALYNPDWAPDMAKIRKLNPNSPKAQSEFEKLLTKIVNTNEATRTSTQAATAASRVAIREEEEDKL